MRSTHSRDGGQSPIESRFADRRPNAAALLRRWAGYRAWWLLCGLRLRERSRRLGTR
jgi:hypothetical protein